MNHAYVFRTLDIFGFYLPPLLLWALVAFVPYYVLTWLGKRVGFYAFVWHRPLFDVALYIIILGALMFGLPFVTGGASWL